MALKLLTAGTTTYHQSIVSPDIHFSYQLAILGTIMHSYALHVAAPKEWNQLPVLPIPDIFLFKERFQNSLSPLAYFKHLDI